MGSSRRPKESISYPAQMDLGGACLTVTLDVDAGLLRLDWAEKGGKELGNWGLILTTGLGSPLPVLSLKAGYNGRIITDGFTTHAMSRRAFMKRLRRSLPAEPTTIQFGLRTSHDIGPAKAGCWHLIETGDGEAMWVHIERVIKTFAMLADGQVMHGTDKDKIGIIAADLVARFLLGQPFPEKKLGGRGTVKSRPVLHNLQVIFDQVEKCATFAWMDRTTGLRVATGRIGYEGPGLINWNLTIDGVSEKMVMGGDPDAVVKAANIWLGRLHVDLEGLEIYWKRPPIGKASAVLERAPAVARGKTPGNQLVDYIVEMAEALDLLYSPDRHDLFPLGGGFDPQHERYIERRRRKEQKRAEDAARLRAAVERAKADLLADEQRQIVKPVQKPRAPVAPPPARELPPPVAVTLHLPEAAWQETTLPLETLEGYALRERAAVWWVSNQSDDLLCLPQCNIVHLEHQKRAVLRVLGTLQGRALLSDEVGLGKTIEAGLVIKELLTRGMVRRFLVLTLPSLVDQWEEELSDKFGLATVTTNHPEAKSDPTRFWRENQAVVASLHTVKQPASLALACEGRWDLIVVDEAHHLRNRESQAWQAVNVLPRHYLLLLTATPVQNSLEELYNLVTLLKPGQLPTPKEFRARFIDPKRPRQPRSPEELRRLLGQVMIRNTRVSAGINLPPRRAETVLFEPDGTETIFWKQWDGEFRAALACLPASQAGLWARLLLQAAGSSPDAWSTALAKFPDSDAVRRWRMDVPPATSWLRKVRLLEPLARMSGGVVVFTQFIETQSALAAELAKAGLPVFSINGSTPAPRRQPITDDFRHQGGVLLLTQSGTEGRNLQFCNNLANFDLPWNPMVIEQRIGRLHRIGQTKPVNIYNFVQKDTLQEHLLNILQEKLNLFELVVGETGLVLGDRFSGDELEEELFRRWRDHADDPGAALARLGDELAAARAGYNEVKLLDETLFAKDFESS